MRFYSSEYFSPEDTVECGQLFRYDRLDLDDYIVYSLDKKCRIVKSGDKVQLESEDEDYFENYFDLKRDYQQINKSLLEYPELLAAARAGKGIRILKQSLYETIISFIISANNNIPRIRGIIDKLCLKHGHKMKGYNAFPSLAKECNAFPSLAKEYNAFPSLETLGEISAEEFRTLGAGFRDRYLAKTSKELSSTDLLSRLTSEDNETAFKTLCSLKGIGAKVANCIMLFGLGRLDRFPVDVWMFKALASQTLDTPSKVTEFYMNRYGEHAGIAQQYIFYHARSKAMLK